MKIAEISGLWLLDKPIGVSSRKFMDQAMQQLGIKKAGHCGTLDPLSSGLLIVLTGQARKLQHLFTGLDKNYLAEVTLGANSETDDGEGELTPCDVEQEPKRSDVENAVLSFQGEIVQKPPAYSAIKIKGTPAYKKARRGQKLDLAGRKVMIHSIKITEYHYPVLKLHVHCGCGVYIRSLARDIGAKLATGGYIRSLRRTSIGDFNIEQAHSLEQLNREAFVSLEQALQPFAKIELPTSMLDSIKHGRKIPWSEDQGEFIIWIDGKVVALARTKDDLLCPKKLLIPIE